MKQAIAVLGADTDRLGHGRSHVTKVAVDAGAIILVEREKENPTDRVLRRLPGSCGRCPSRHQTRGERPRQEGAQEAQRILRDFDLSQADRFGIASAIEYHEAFRPVPPLDEPAWKLLSDALDDADNFRWGPDTSEMLWDMVSRRDVPLSKVLGWFLKGMEGVDRSGKPSAVTGRHHGPDSIDRGMEIGRRLYEDNY